MLLQLRHEEHSFTTRYSAKPLAHRLAVRAAEERDLPAILDLLEPQEFIKPLTRSHLQRCFLYGWRRPDQDLGLVIVDPNGTIGGVLQLIYSPPRRVANKTVVTSNLSTLFIKPGFRFERDRSTGTARRLATDILRRAMGRPCLSLSYSAHGPNDVVAKMGDDLGFERISEALVFSRIGFSRPLGRTSLRGLDGEQQQFVDDHRPYGCHAIVVDDCLVIAKRTQLKAGVLFPGLRKAQGRRVPVTEILHMSAPAALESVWGRVVASLCWHDCSIGVVCTESFFTGWTPAGPRIPQVFRVYNRTMPVSRIDKLYSEAVLLP